VAISSLVVRQNAQRRRLPLGIPGVQSNTVVALSETTQAVPRGFQDAGRLVVRLVRRSRQTLSHDHDNLLLIKDLSAAMSRCRNDVDAIATWDIAKDSSVRRGMKALFEEKLDTGVLEDYQLKRTSWSEPAGANQLERTSWSEHIWWVCIRMWI
jgi:hypothetical protein